ncbi:MAG TPA: hypothetical protein P5525_10170 [Candidatus Paceibacterota bacterium]|nr:hypothetical protein [Candidatus Paceibacterota bacterium]
MICDICSATIVGAPAALLGTKEVVTCKDCWKLYLNSLIADGVFRGEDIPNALAGFVGEMASSDTPWALCQQCVAALTNAGFALPSASRAVAPRGHALCRHLGPVQYEITDDESMKLAFQAALSAAREILPEAKIELPRVVVQKAATRAGGGLQRS